MIVCARSSCSRRSNPLANDHAFDDQPVLDVAGREVDHRQVAERADALARQPLVQREASKVRFSRGRETPMTAWSPRKARPRA